METVQNLAYSEICGVHIELPSNVHACVTLSFMEIGEHFYLNFHTLKHITSDNHFSFIFNMLVDDMAAEAYSIYHAADEAASRNHLKTLIGS